MTTNTAAPLPRTVEAIDDALLNLHHDLNTVIAEVYVITRDAMLAAVRGATMHLRYGRIERAAEIVEGITADLHLVGLTR